MVYVELGARERNFVPGGQLSLRLIQARYTAELALRHNARFFNLQSFFKVFKFDVVTWLKI